MEPEGVKENAMKKKLCLVLIVFVLLSVSVPAFGDESEYSVVQEMLDAEMLLPVYSAYGNAEFSIEGSGYSVQCYHGENYQWQEIVNAEDSALILPWNNNTLVLADHYNQGFSIIREAGPFLTTADLSDGIRYDRYICVAVIPDAYNAGNYLAYSDWSSIEADYPNSLITYTCNTDYAPGTITVTVWYMLPEEYKN